MNTVPQKEKKTYKDKFADIPTEFEFNRALQKLERAIDQEEKKDENRFVNFIEECDFGGKTDFGEFLYERLGVVGGAYIFVDKANGELLSFYNRGLQKELIERLERSLSNGAEEEGKSLPFIEIKYQYYNYDKHYYNDPNEELPIRQQRVAAARTFRNVLDALFIGARERQKIRLSNFPEFYAHRPAFRSEREKNKILPFEKKLNQDGLDIIYCETGEVLFHTFAWRYLFRLVQLRGKDGYLVRAEQNFDYDKNFSFWEEMAIQENTPEGYWINYLNNKPDLKSDWRKLRSKVDSDPFEEGYGFTLDVEYELLGLLDQKSSSGDRIVSRSFLSLVRYVIHIAEFFLGWSAQDVYKSTPPDFVKNSTDKEKLEKNTRTLTHLFIVERKLDIYFQEDNTDDVHFQDFIPTLNQLKVDYNIHECINRVVQAYLFFITEKKKKAKLSRLIEALHQDCRFPILPYYYEIAASEYHLPKEHIVLRIWHSEENKVKFKLGENEEDKEDSGLGFVALTIKPMYKTYYRKSLIIGDKSTHCISYLSEEAFTRIFRLKTLFRNMARPIIDNVFYGALIKKDIQRANFKKYLHSFSHEMSKITDNIFEKSSIRIEDFFKSDTPEVIEAVRPYIKSVDGDFDYNSLKDWKLIPNPDIFEIWGLLLRVWSGRRQHQIFHLSKEASLEEIIDKCALLGIQLNTGIEKIGGETRSNIQIAQLFKKEFNEKVAATKEEIPLLIKESIGFDMAKLKMIGNGNEVTIEKQNAFLRLLLATIVNIYEHSSKGYGLKVKRLFENGKDELLFSFVNPFKELVNEKTPESLGTKPVLESCLNRLLGDLLYFKQMKNEAEIAEWETHIQLKEDENFWKSEFRFPVEHIFC